MINTNNTGYEIEEYKLGYRACIPFYILLDPDLSRNHLVLYGLIEQMESSKGDVYFTNETLGKIIGVDARSVQRLKAKLEQKNYLKRELKTILINGNMVERHCWNTIKGRVVTNEIREDAQCPPVVKDYAGGDTDGQGGGDTDGQGGGDTDGPPCNTHDLKSQNVNVCVEKTEKFEKSQKPENPTQQQLLRKQKTESAALTDTKNTELFNSKFANREITIEELFKNCQTYNESKGRWVDAQLFNRWLQREHADNFPKKNSHQAKKQGSGIKMEVLHSQWMNYYNADVEIDCRAKGFPSKNFEEWVMYVCPTH